jgi:Mg-chelatase subunit ChlD
MASWRKGGEGGERNRPGDGGRGEPSRRSARPDPEAHSKPPAKPVKSSWRKQKTAAPVAAGSGPGGSRYYRQTGGFFGFLFGRRLKLWTLACLFALLLGGIVWFLLSVPSPVPIVAVAVSSYKDPRIPHNLTALTDLERLNSYTQDFRKVDVSIEKTKRDDFTAAFAKKLKEVTPGGSAFSRKSVIIYISAHGVVNGEAKPCLLLADSDPLDETTWYPVTDVLTAIKAEPGFRDATKLLALDCCRIRSDWRLGILDNRFGERLLEEIQNAEIPDLAVLTSASPGEQAWSSPELGGGTVFGHFLALGLHGAAARHAAAKVAGFASILPKETLAVGELCDYVRNHVNRWVSATRGAEQTPQLITPKSQTASLKNSDLAWISQHGPSDDSPAGTVRRQDDAERRKMLAQLKTFWSEHQQRQDSPAWRLYPLRWAELELRLLRYEELYLDAVSESEALETARNEVEKALRALDERLSPIVFSGSAPLGKNYPGAADDAGPIAIEPCFDKMLEQHVYESDRQKLAGQIGQAREVRRQVEDLAAPVDPRVLYWLRPMLNSVDENRRKAEDLLFVGNPSSLAEAEALWSKLLGGADSMGDLPQARAQRDAVAEAVHRRDEVWARLWWLGRWLYDNPAQKPEQTAALADSFDKLVDAADALSRDLESIHAGESPPLAETAAAAGAAYDKVATAFGQQEHDTQKSREDAGQLENSGAFGALHGLLAVPLVSGVERDRLREQYDRIVGKIHEAGLGLVKDWRARREGGDASSAGATAQRARQAVERLLVIESPSGDAETAPADRLLRSETAIRKSLAKTLATIAAAAAASDQEISADRPQAEPGAASDGVWLKDDLARRVGLSAADLESRRRAWFTPRLESKAALGDRTWQPPTKHLMRFDRAALALWHCDRTLDDFWGPLPGGPDKTPYFSRAARAYLAALASDEAVKHDPYFADRRSKLEAKLDMREKATRLTTTVAEKTVVFEAQVEERKQTVTASSAAGAPAGVAAVFLAEPNGRELNRSLWHQDREHPDVWRQGVALSADAPRIPVGMTIRKEVTAGARGARKLAAGALFRGHVSNDADSAGSFTAQLRLVRAIEPPVVAAAPPEIRVKGSRHSITELIFIVDASGSMTENIQGRETKALGEQKWTLAKNAIQTILSELQSRQGDWEANDEEWRAALMVYGHRAVWLNQIGNVQYNKAATAEERQKWAADQVFPHTDVELLVNLARFDGELAGKISAALGRASPWGPTPLYYALREAVKVFDSAPHPGGDQPNRHIVLVTDGVNNPMPPKGGVEVVPGALQAVLKNFKQAHQNAAVRIDVVYFGAVLENERDALQGLTSFVKEANALADGRGQSKSTNMHIAANPENLIYHLRSAVEAGRLKFRVVRAGTQSPEVEYKPANSTWALAGPAKLPDKFTVQIDGTPEAAQDVRLEGGESLRLVFKKDKLEFEQQADEKGLLKRITAGVGQQRLTVYPFVPGPGADDVLFKFGVQYVDRFRFTPRPSDFWAEVVPIRQDADGTAHADEDDPAVFYDRSFVPAQRMPVLQFKFPKWPAAANAARVRLWLQFPDDRGRSPIEPLRIKYADVARVSSVTGQGLILPDFPVLLRVSESAIGGSAVRITVAEQQVDDGRPRDWSRIELSGRPDAVTHRYFLGERRAEHIFEFQEGNKPEAAELEVLLTPAATLKNNAVPIPTDEADVRLLPVQRAPVQPGGN